MLGPTLSYTYTESQKEEKNEEHPIQGKTQKRNDKEKNPSRITEVLVIHVRRRRKRDQKRTTKDRLMQWASTPSSSSFWSILILVVRAKRKKKVRCFRAKVQLNAASNKLGLEMTMYSWKEGIATTVCTIVELQ